ncbi:hypothetical protein OAA09_00575 [bacterium]|nr:hypothetical protein [bacterium]
MGGLGGDSGHLNHLYEDYGLTFGRLKKLLNLVEHNKITLYEKVDGQNLSLTHNPKLHKTFAARNKSDLKAGGVDTLAMEKRYAADDKSKVKLAFTSAMKAFYKSVMELSYYQRFQIFDSSLGGIPFINLEVMSIINPNVIKYSGNYLVMHSSSRYKKGTAQGANCTETFQTIIKSMANSVVPTPTGLWMIKGPTEINLSGTSNTTKMNQAIQDLDNFMIDNHLEDDDTIGDYIEGQIVLRHLENIELSSEIENEFINRMLDVPGTRPTPSIVKNIDWSWKEQLLLLAKSRKSVVRKIILPLEMIINDFGIGLLENSHSSFVDDGPDQALELQEKTAEAINLVRKENNPAVIEKLDMHLKKLGKDLGSSITSTVEGVVFADPDDDDISYKITGAFAPMNQILGFVNPGFAKSRVKELPKSSSPTLPIFVA